MDRGRPARAEVTLGLLAGGAGRRLGGVDKAWLRRDGTAQVARLAELGTTFADTVLVSSNADPQPFRAHGWTVVRDRQPGLGPIGGLEALAHACRTRWLLTLPVDLADVPMHAINALLGAAARSEAGCRVVDADGSQPLVAIWRTRALQAAAAECIAAGSLAVHSLQARLGMVVVRMPGVRFGNLNTEADLRAHGVSRPPPDDSR